MCILTAANHLQGSTWSVRRRNYHTHDAKPETLQAVVRPTDVPYLPQAALYAVWSDKRQVCWEQHAEWLL